MLSRGRSQRDVDAWARDSSRYRKLNGGSGQRIGVDIYIALELVVCKVGRYLLPLFVDSWRLPLLNSFKFILDHIESDLLCADQFDPKLAELKVGHCLIANVPLFLNSLDLYFRLCFFFEIRW